MFSKEELLEKDIPELESIAKDLEAEYKKNRRQRVYHICYTRQASNECWRIAPIGHDEAQAHKDSKERPR